eukprot:c19170_g1_i3.p1 GENE.c19170_g1_i3~~c19170_g1_i3.p1  ORF type:complete len:217 (+),score=56.51 c19170_g1_i3:1303-1953(+)
MCSASEMELSDGTTKLWSRKRVCAQERSKIRDAAEMFDVWAAEVAASVPVDVMSGASDPCNKSLPQPPLHPCFFPAASQLKSLCCVPNPYDFSLGSVRFLGTSGQPVTDMMQYVNCDDPLEILAQCLLARHLAPTCPDTLACLPFESADPFLIGDAECPHVMFAGNQHAFSTRVVEGDQGQRVRLVCVPNFAETGQVVLVNLSTLDASVVSFSCDV